MALTKYIVPNGGWMFVDGDTVIKEDDLDKLVLAVVAHRINNGKDMGSPTQEIEDQIEKRKNVNIP